jgi:hypothetical protein
MPICKRIKLNHYLSPYAKLNSKGMDKETTGRIGENICKHFIGTNDNYKSIYISVCVKTKSG